MIYEYGGQIKCRYNFWTYVISTMIGKHTFVLDYYILVALSKLVDKIGFKMYNNCTCCILSENVMVPSTCKTCKPTFLLPI